MTEAKKWIAKVDWKAILDWATPLSEIERKEALQELLAMDLENLIGFAKDFPENKAYYAQRRNVTACWQYAQIVLVRQYSDIALTEKVHTHFSQIALDGYLRSPELGVAPLVAYFQLFPPDYLDKFLENSAKKRFYQADFKVLWILYEKGWVHFKEEFFVRRLFGLYQFEHDHREDAQFLLEHPELVFRVFCQFYKYELPILDLIKCKSLDYSNGLSLVASNYWTEVFKILLTHNALPKKELMASLLSSLLNNWKKGHLDWHIRLIELLEPSDEDYVQQQETLFSLLHSSQVSIVNFTVKNIEEIYAKEGFQLNSFLANLPSLLAKDKCEKSILKVLEIVDYFVKKGIKLPTAWEQNMTVVFVQSDPKVQKKAAILLKPFLNEETRQELALSYGSGLKTDAKAILDIQLVEEQEDVFESDQTEWPSCSVPATWDDLLYQIGTCIHTKSAKDLDLFLEGLNQLQNDIPLDFAKQLKPYLKQLNGRFWEVYVMGDFRDFLNTWAEGVSKYPKPDKDSPRLFLRHKCYLLHNKLQKKNKLPFLSTPTHLPYFIDPTILVERLLVYEEVKQAVDEMDLLVACNRIHLDLISEVAKEKAKQLKGIYSSAIRYILGVHDALHPKELVSLWTQVARTKHPQAQFIEFNKTEAHQFPSVGQPFFPKFQVDVNTSEGGQYTWYPLHLENAWNYNRYFSYEKIKPLHYPDSYLYSSPFQLASRADIPYLFSLVPHYPDALACRYIPHHASGNEVAEQELALYPMQTLLENRLKVHHGGWLYVASCLLFDKKVSRDLAADYVFTALQEGWMNSTYFSEVVGTLIQQKYAPVARLFEFIERPYANKAMKELKWNMLRQCVLQADATHLPNGFKKVPIALQELTTQLQRTLPEDLLQKIKTFKK